MTRLEHYVMLDYYQLETDVTQIVTGNDFMLRHDVDGIVRDLWANGIRSREALTDNNDQGMFWAIVDDHENTSSF